MPNVQFLLHDDTLATRHVLLGPNDDIVHFHPGYTREDWEAGWRSVKGEWVDDEATLPQMVAEVAASSRQYWEDLVQRDPLTRIVLDGCHHTLHELGTTAGYGGKVFEVRWLDPSRAPAIGHLWQQGRIPAWVRPQLPDNAAELVERPDIPSPFDTPETLDEEPAQR